MLNDFSRSQKMILKIEVKITYNYFKKYIKM